MPEPVSVEEQFAAREALPQGEQEFQTLVEAMPQMVWTARPDGWNTYFNQRWVEYTGQTLEESYGEGWSTPFHPDDRERAQEAWRQATSTGGTYELEVRLRRADGAYRWWLIRGSPFRDAGGAITKWLGTCTDIEVLRQARSGLELNAANYDALFDTTLLGIAHGEIVLDDQGRPVDYRYLKVNSTFEELTGLTREDVVGRTMREIVPGFEDSAFDFIGVHGMVALTGEPVEFEQYQQHLGRWYSVHVYSPRRGQFISMFSDITERKRAEEALRESEYLLAASQRAAHVGAWSWKVGDSTTYWSDETYRIYGLSPEMGPPSYEFFFEILHPDDRQKLREFPAAIIAGLQPPPLDCRVLRSDGTYRTIRSEGDVVETVDGVPSRIAGTAYDVTERKRAEEQLAQKTRLYATLSQVNQMIVRVKEPAELYQSICDVAVEFGEFALAWVGLLDEGSGDVRPVAANGADVANWPFEMVNTHKAVSKNGLVATAIRSHEIAITGDIESDEKMPSVPGQIEGRDHHAIAAIPFGPRAKTVGVLVLVSRRAGLFKEASEVGLLKEMSLDISFALDSMATEAERRATEESLRESEEQNRGLFESIPVPMSLQEVVCDAGGKPVDYRFLYVNPAFERFMNTKAADLVGHTIVEVAPKVNRAFVERAGRVALSGVPDHFEGFSVGLQRYHETTVFSPRPGQCVTHVADVTERKIASEELARMSERLALATRSAHLGIWDWDVANDRLVWDDGMYELYGVTSEDFGGAYDTWLRGLHPEDRARCEEETRQALKAGRDYESEFRVVWPDGTVRHLRASAAVLRDEAGNPLRMIGVNFDITERSQMAISSARLMHQVQDELVARRRAEEEIRGLNETLEARVQDRTAALELANRELEAFSYSVSHDLRAPLRHMDGFSRILLDKHADQLDAEAQRLLGIVVHSAQEMGVLIDDLLRFSRVARKDLERRPVDMDRLVRSVCEDLRLGEPERAIEFEVGTLCSVPGDQALLRQVWTNLLGNAVKFTRPAANPRIEVRCESALGVCRYTVRDNGAGFDATYADNLFQPFQRLHNTSEFEGSGIGLAIVARIVQRHGGRVWAESMPGAGATFGFSLPEEET